MKKQSLTFSTLIDRPGLWLAIIFLAGCVLRLANLGQDSFWLDEAGVAYAARAATLGEMLQVVRSHVLAMPLDYLVVWLVGRVSLTEAALRLPAALFGCASLLLAYHLYRRFVPALPALLAVLVLVLSPLHVQYSQELRFYASLVFFYLLSTLAQWDALQQPSARGWALAAAATITGVYFHPYVMFSLANGLVWLALRPQRTAEARSLRTGFLFYATVCLLAFLVGYLTFSASNVFDIPLMVYELSPLGALATGMGWLPFALVPPGLSWLWGAACAGLEIAGVIFLLRQNPRSPLAGLFYSLVLQLAAVIGSDLLGHYFFAPRQLLMLLPLLCLFAGIGAQRVVAGIHGWLAQRSPRHAQITAIAVTALLLAAISIPALQVYASDDKGDTRRIIQTVLEQWQPGDSVLITPSYDGFVYKYYIEYASQRADVASRLWAADWQDVLNAASWPGTLFVITPARLTVQESDELRRAGFAEQFTSSPTSRYAKTLWVRASGTH